MANRPKIDVSGTGNPRADRLREMARAAGFDVDQSVQALATTPKTTFQIWSGDQPPPAHSVHVWCRDGWGAEFWKDVQMARNFCQSLGLDSMLLHEMSNSPGLPILHVVVLRGGGVRSYRAEEEALRYLIDQATYYCGERGEAFT